MFQGVALITGGSSGIGLALAAQLLDQGASVVICGRDMSRLQAACAQLETSGERLLAVQADVTQSVHVQSVIAQASERFGRIDALINSAGIGALGPLTEVSEEVIDQLLATNVKGPLLTSRAIWPVMAAQKSGHIVNLCGILGIKTIANGALYTATKHAVSGLGNALALEGRRSGIRVTNIYCSAVDSPFWEGVPGKPRADALLSPAEVAQAIADLLAMPAHVVPNQLMLQHIAHQL